MKRGRHNKPTGPKLRPPGPLPTVALVGRPNVGKSSLFNRLIGERKAIVHEKPGVTRDRLYGVCSRDDRWFNVIDTGGLEVGKALSDYASLIRQQVQVALEEADLVLFITEAPFGLVGEDSEIARLLRKKAKKVIVVANKSDAGHEGVEELEHLGLGQPLLVTSKYGEGIRRLCAIIAEQLDIQIYEQPELDQTLEDTSDPSDFSIRSAPRVEELPVAIVGRPNVGKSALFNRLVQQERSLVAPIPGTTRDSIDTVIEIDGNKYRFIDTAGLRKRGKVTESLEYYSTVRAAGALERAEVALLVIDLQEGVTAQDQRIAGLAEEQGRAIVILANKWDLVREGVREHLDNYLEEGEAPDKPEFDRKLQQARRDLITDFRRRLKFLAYAPVLFTSAESGTGLQVISRELEAVREQYEVRIGTGALNRWLQEALIAKPPRMRGTRVPKFYYATQPEVKPPTVVLFVNDPELVHFSYRRYLANAFREAFALDKTPLSFIFRPRPRKERK